MAEDLHSIVAHAPTEVAVQSAPEDPAAKAAFWVFWDEHKVELRKCCRICLGASADAAEVEDCLSSAMLHAFERLPAEPLVNAKAWLTSVVRNFCMDQHRNPRRHLSRSFGADSLEQTGDSLKQLSEEDIEATLERQESNTALRQAVDQLPGRLREVMELRLMDFDYDEIAVQLGVSKDNVRKRAQESRILLKPLLLQFGRTPAREKTTPDASAVRSTEGRRADGNSMPGYRPPAHAHVVRSVDGGRQATPVLCFTADPPERLEQRSQTLEKYIAQHPGGHVKHIELAELHMLQGNWSRSIALLNPVLTQCPHLGLLRVRVAAMHLRLGARGEAVELLRTGAALPATQVMALFLQGALAFCEGDAEAAERHWQACRALNPQWAMPLHALLGLAFHQNNLLRAVALLDKGLHGFPDDRILHFWNCCLPGAPNEVLQRAHEAVKRFPADGVAALQLRRACLLAGEAAPSLGRPERRSRFEVVDLDLQLLAAARAGNLKLAATLVHALPQDLAISRAWQEWLSTPISSEFPPSPLARFAPVLPL